jgi:hypothetical protein
MQAASVDGDPGVAETGCRAANILDLNISIFSGRMFCSDVRSVARLPHARGCNRRRASFALLQPRLGLNWSHGFCVNAANRSRPIVLTELAGGQLHSSMLSAIVPSAIWPLQPPPSLPKVWRYLLRTGLIQAGPSRRACPFPPGR